MNYLEQLRLAENGEFQGRVRQALVTVAVDIFTTPPKLAPADPIKYAARQTGRQALAKNILAQPATYQRNWSAVIVAGKDFTPEATDDEITAAVRKLWNVVAGLEAEAEEVTAPAAAAGKG